MARAIEEGIPKLRVEEAAARTQARIDSGRQPVIGVNKYPVTGDDDIDVLKIDNRAVRAQQLDKLRRLREERDAPACRAALDRLTAAAARPVKRAGEVGGGTDDDNLLALAIGAAARRPRWARSPTPWRRYSAGTPGISVRSAACTAKSPATPPESSGSAPRPRPSSGRRGAAADPGGQDGPGWP